MDRSHEARIELAGKNRLDIMHRISTNDLMNMDSGEGRPTIFTSPTARILDRVMVYNRDERTLVLGEPGRGAPLAQYLQRNIFFGDDVRVVDLATVTNEFDLHGPQADNVIELFAPGAVSLPDPHGLEAVIGDKPVFIARRKPVSGSRWTIITPSENAAAVWSRITERGTSQGLMPAGSLTYNTLRIRAGLPGVGRELSQDYIPLEVGLWDEVSFKKGCYTGQEIIARMESRSRLANTIVALEMDKMVNAPATIYHEGRSAGQLTSSVLSPDNEIYSIAVIKVPLARAGQSITVGENGVQALVKALLGVQPPQLVSESTAQLN
jgi:folate-binding protein YgfZ